MSDETTEPKVDLPGPASPPVLHRPGGSRNLALVALAVAIVTAGALAYWVVGVAGPSRARLDEILAGTDRDFTSLLAETRAQQQALSELSAGQAALQARFTSLTKSTEALAARVARSAVPEGHVLRIARVAHLVQVADLALRVENDPARALVALEAARNQLEPLRPVEAAFGESLAPVVAALQAVHLPPVAELSAEWAALSPGLEQLPLALAPARQTASAIATRPEGWRGVLQAMWQDLLGLVEIKKLTPATRAFMDPARHALVIAMMREEIALLRVALLRRDDLSLRTSAQVLGTALERDFAADAPEVVELRGKLSALAGLELRPALPDLSRCLALLPTLSEDPAVLPAPVPEPALENASEVEPPPADPREIM